MKDSKANDQLVATSDSVTLQNPTYLNRVNQFESVFVYASEGHDSADLSDSAGNDKATLSPVSARIRGEGFNHFISRFDTVTIESHRGGTDAAFFTDSANDDQMFASADFARMSGDSFYNLRSDL